MSPETHIQGVEDTDGLLRAACMERVCHCVAFGPDFRSESGTASGDAQSAGASCVAGLMLETWNAGKL